MDYITIDELQNMSVISYPIYANSLLYNILNMLFIHFIHFIHFNGHFTIL